MDLTDEELKATKNMQNPFKMEVTKEDFKKYIGVDISDEELKEGNEFAEKLFKIMYESIKDEKTADKMFEEMNYFKSEIITKVEGYKKTKGFIVKEINFDKQKKSLITRQFNLFNKKYEDIVLDMQELKAIYKKCEELRMALKKEWKEIKNYEGKYIISNYGEVISLPRYKQNNNKLQYVEPKEICRYVNKCNGYVYVQLWNNSNYKNIRLHRLVAEHFIDNKENKKQINHIDGNKQNNRVDNLEWCTCSENIRHAYRMGLRKQKKGG